MATNDNKHTHLTVGEVRNNFSDISNRVAYAGERMIVDRYNKPLVALIPIEDLELLEALENAYDVKLARERLKTLKKGGTISLEELEKELKNENIQGSN